MTQGNIIIHSTKNEFACPICGGWKEMPRKQGIRCWGFTNGHYTRCTREEHSGDLSVDEMHFVKRGHVCNCGEEHDEIRNSALTGEYKPSKRKQTNFKPLIKKIQIEAEPITGTAGERYFNNRGIKLDPSNQPDSDFMFQHALKFHPSVEWHGKKYPTVVGLLRNMIGNVQGLHLIFLEGDNKAPIENPKISIGEIGSSAVNLARAMTSPEPYSIALVSGIEDGLAIQQMTGIPTLAVVGDVNLPKVDIHDAIIKVYLYGDGDTSGRKYSAAAKEVLETQEFQVERIVFPEGLDANDTLINNEQSSGE